MVANLKKLMTDVYLLSNCCGGFKLGNEDNIRFANQKNCQESYISGKNRFTTNYLDRRWMQL